jgi:hypothetical protein
MLAASGLALSGCLAGPTYGTGKGAHEQLLEDVTGVLSVGPSDDKEPIEYNPRPEIVKPPTTAVLPPPQEPIATAGNPAWPESPEERRARIRAEATAKRDEPGFRPAIVAGSGSSTPAQTRRATKGDDLDIYGNVQSVEAQRAEFNRRLALSQQGSPTTRRFLSEPPLDYRQPAATAPVGDIGEDEWRKERRQKASARKKGSGGWRDLVPWL